MVYRKERIRMFQAQSAGSGMMPMRGEYPRHPWWSECGWPKDGSLTKACGRPTVDGIACAKHAAKHAARKPNQPGAK